MAPNENKMSDSESVREQAGGPAAAGKLQRVSIGVKGWKPSQNVDAER